jgi:hemerythrin
MHAKWEKGKGAIGYELAFFLKNWLTKHIIEGDKRYTAHFLAQGIRPDLAKGSWTKRFWRSLSGS